jgi:hypothetical protein
VAQTRPGCRKAITTRKTDKPNAPESKTGHRSTGLVNQGWCSYKILTV